MYKVLIKLFKELFTKFPSHFFILIIIVFAEGLLNILSVLSIAPLTDFLTGDIYTSPNQVTIFMIEILKYLGLDIDIQWFLMQFVLINIFAITMGIGSIYAVLRIKFDVLKSLLIDTMSDFFNAKLSFFNTTDKGILLNSFQQEINKVGDNFGAIASLLANMLQLFVFLVLPFVLSPYLTIVFLLTVGILLMPLFFIRKLAYSLGLKNTQAYNVTVGIVQEILSSAKLILSFGKQGFAVRQYGNAFKYAADSSIRHGTLLQSLPKVFNGVGLVALAVTVFLGYQEESIVLSDIAMVVFSFFRIIPLISIIMHGKTSIESFVPAYEQLDKLRSNAFEYKEVFGSIEFKVFKNNLLFNNVTYSYPNRKPALKDVSIEIKKGMMTAIVGRSGSGKTTLVDMILGLYQQNTGVILIDGKELTEYDLNSYRRKVGYVPQDPQLFNATVRDNMIWSAPGASENEIWQACRLANAEDFVMGLPDRLETNLGDRGVLLSGGQRQRLALARAIIRKPEILILDEATSSLDTESERLIQQSIDRLSNKMTIVIIAHRLSTIRNSDYVYVMGEGMVIEDGTYNELMQKQNSHLSQMVVEQAL